MSLVTGPRQVSSRRIVGLPRALLRSVGLEPPVKVALSADEGARETILITAMGVGQGFSASVSSVGQLVLPTSLMTVLNLDSDRSVYVRAREDRTVLEMMSPRQTFEVARSAERVDP
ncbi:hypothetical protein [Homoserinibacter sp. YIM 151385]|uniref:hypothetical protein n=1 Tax=Homoserinibacter sp. YIM 151385 TaxID=2985506 RepID=UPI0022F0029F|nr:hypothetical protein [Homoserinibacter sp. YIM 151385]WBU37354.1 hypothetical protein OF852_10570 [Homoserinibacter sp. YIM 151385]